ncbi:unnamed protein product, partial [Coregonus sp. 'balchen']
MVRETVDAMREHCPNPNRAVCSEIAKSTVTQYPKIFGDLTEEVEPLDSVYHSLFTKIKTGVQHKNRNHTLDRIRRPKRSYEEERDISGQAKTARTKVGSYSCINWQTQDLPEKETPDSLENKRQAMATIFSCVGPRGADKREVGYLMKLTYTYQRHMINTCPPSSISDLQEHYGNGIEIDSRLTQALLNKGKRIANFFRSQKTKGRRAIQCLLNEIDGYIRGNNDLTATAAILLLMTHFIEKDESLFLLADVTATRVDVEVQIPLPNTPRLIVL